MASRSLPAEAQQATPEPADEGARVRGWSYAAKIASVAVVVSLLGLLVWATLAAGRGQKLVAQIVAGKKPSAPEFQHDVIWPHTETWPPLLRDALADEKVSLAELRGHPVVINFWASWCIPCRDEAPILAAAARAYRGQVVFVGIDVKDLTSDARRFLREYRVNYVSLHARGDETYGAYGLTGVPETFYVDARGRAVAHSPGAVSRRTLEAGIATIVRQPR